MDVQGIPLVDHSADASLLGNLELDEAYDFVVCGAGSAGAIVAARLSENPAWSVLLVEAGTEDVLPAMAMPAAVATLQRGQSDWGYKTEPMEGAAQGMGGVSNWPRGKTLGGSSQLNYMLYVRGHPEDYKSWAELSGDDSWNFEGVLPFFKKTESLATGSLVNDLDAEFHGDDGPVTVTHPAENASTPLMKAMLAAAEETGLPELANNVK